MMAREIFGTLKQLFSSLYDDLVEMMLGYQKPRYLKYVGIVILVSLCAGSGYFGYRFYSGYRDRSAQYSLGTLFDLYLQEQARGEQIPDNYLQIAEKAAEYYRGHKSATCAALFKVMQSSALVAGGKKDEARAALEEALGRLSDSNPFTSLIKTKYALISLESDNESINKKGLDMLTALGYDTSNIFRDYALKQLGMYYWVRDAIPEASKVWQELLDGQKMALDSQSPWLPLVAEKLESVSFER